jgi:capsular exopolysaccharide synthesis family protein
MVQNETPLSTQAPNGLDAMLPPAGPEPEDQDTIKIHELLDTFYRRRWLIIGIILLVFGLGMAYTLTRPMLYQSTVTILVSPSNGGRASNDISILMDLQSLTQQRSVDTQIEIITSPDMLKKAAKKLSDDEIQAAFKTNHVKQGFVRASGQKNTDIIDITVRAFNAKVAKKFADALAQTYFDEDKVQNREATKLALAQVELSLEIAKEKMGNAHDRLTAFKERTGLIAPDAQVAKIANALADLRAGIDSAFSDLNANRHLTDSLRKQINAQSQTVIAQSRVMNNPRFSALVANLDTLQADRARQVQEYTPASPEVKAIDEQIKTLEGQLKKLAETIVAEQTHTTNPLRAGLLDKYAAALAQQAALNGKLQALNAEYRIHQTEAKVLPKQERQLSELMQDVQLYTTTYNMLTEKQQELIISQNATLSSGRVIAEGTYSSVAVSPKVKNNAMLLLVAGIFFAIVCALIVERVDDHIHDQKTAETLTGAVTMTAIPELTPDAPKLITDVDRHSPFLESFRVLRNNIAFTAVDRHIHTIAVTSPGPSEGKSTTCANLAIIMAMDGKKVVVIDFDLHRPSMHNVMKRSRDVGFTSVLTGTAKLEDAVVPTDVPNVFFLPPGPLPPNPTEILNSQAARTLFNQLSEQYDAVVVDCPPCTKLSDVQVISTLVDGMLLLMALERTLKTGLRMTTRALHQVNAPLIGIVLNRMDIRNRRYGYYYSYYYAYRYEEAESTDGTVVRTRVKSKDRSRNKSK